MLKIKVKYTVLIYCLFFEVIKHKKPSSTLATVACTKWRALKKQKQKLWQFWKIKNLCICLEDFANPIALGSPPANLFMRKRNNKAYFKQQGQQCKMASKLVNLGSKCWYIQGRSECSGCCIIHTISWRSDKIFWRNLPLVVKEGIQFFLAICWLSQPYYDRLFKSY